MKTPQFLHVPHIKDNDEAQFIIETRKHCYFQIFHFQTNEDKVKSLDLMKEELINNGFKSYAVHMKYPIAVGCFKAGSELTADRLEKLTELACDFYATIWTEKEKSHKIKEDGDYSLWRECDNRLTGKLGVDYMKLMNPTCIVTCPFDIDLIGSFDEWERESRVHILDGSDISEKGRYNILVEAYNFSVLLEKYDEENF